MSEIKEILQELGYSLTDDSQGFRACRVYADGNNKTALLIRKDGSFTDFVDNKSGNFEDLIQLTLGLKSIEDAQNWLKTKDFTVKAPEATKPKIKQQKVFNPDLLLKLLPIHDYWIKRGISEEIITKFKSGLCLTESKFKQRYVFPIFNSKNQILGFAGRCILPDNERHESRPKWKLFGQGNKSSWLYPLFVTYPSIKESKSVIITESIGDCLALAQSGINNTLCLFGTEISIEQTNFLLRANLEKITISLNDDSDKNDAGNNAAVKLKKKLSKYFDSHRLSVKFPIGGKDWNVLLMEKGKEEIIKQFNDH